jgi:GTPase SAR1 family protein
MEAPLMHLALVGTPNSGKTALFNALTGSRQKVANYPGVTVERKEGSFVTPTGRQVSIVDLPGTYSLRGRSPDEEITRDMVLGRSPGEAVPDLVLCVADSTNLRLTIRLLRAKEHRPSADAGAQHVRYRHASWRQRRRSAAVGSTWRTGRDVHRGAQGRHR